MKNLWIAPFIVGVILMLGFSSDRPSGGDNDNKGHISFLNPKGLHRNPAFSQLAVVRGYTRTVYIGGQNAVDSSGKIIGKGDISTQSEQVAKNLKIALAAAEAGVEHIVKWSIYTVEGQPVGPAMAAFQRVLGNQPNPPTISVLFVSSLAHPDFLLEVEAIAVVPEK
jgi:enamine deaminase RidA (YjgF/YER057c/UK114 family)